MEALPEHTIQFSGLKDGSHTFEFTLGTPFFHATGMEEYELGGNVKAKVDLDKSEYLLVANIHVDGYVTMPCDHCNARMDQPVSGDQRQIFKLTDEQGIDDEELVALDVHAHEVNLTHYLFECISLHMPIRHVHPEGQCDPEVDQAFQRIKVDHDPEPDPRWDALKALKDTPNKN
jgi:uncharacterized protein